MFKKIFSKFGNRQLAQNLNKEVILINIENCSIGKLKITLKNRNVADNIVATLIDYYTHTNELIQLKEFRLGPCPFEKIELDWHVLIDTSTLPHKLIGHGISTRINWNKEINQLSTGWQGIVRKSFEQKELNHKNTMVGLFILIENEYRKSAYAETIVKSMSKMTSQTKSDNLIIPLRLPTYFTKENCYKDFAEFALSKREDGTYQDYWLRLHTKLGAEILCLNQYSHRHALSIQDFKSLFSSVIIDFTSSGFYQVQILDGWYNIKVNIDDDLILINQPCVWVKHLVD